MSLQCVSMFFWLALIFFNKICSCSVNPLLIFLLCREVSSWANSFKLSFFNSSNVFPLYVNSFLAIIYLLPVLFGAIFPTFLPGGEFLADWVGIPFACELLPPNGCDTEFIDVPLTLGHILFFAVIANHLEPAFRKGFSVLPEPATIPMAALHSGMNFLLLLEGSSTTIPSSIFVIILANAPEVLTNFPPSPGFDSML